MTAIILGALAYCIGMGRYSARTSRWWFWLALVGFLVMAGGAIVLVS